MPWLSRFNRCVVISIVAAIPTFLCDGGAEGITEDWRAPNPVFVRSEKLFRSYIKAETE